MVRGTGFEPVGEAFKIKGSSDTDSPCYSPPAGADPDLLEVIKAWPSLSAPLRSVVLAIVRAAQS